MIPSAAAASPASSASDAATGPVLPDDVVAANTTPHAVRAIAAGWTICAIREDGTLTCWGGGPTALPKGHFIALDSNDGGTCAIRADGRLACFGGSWGPIPDGAFSSVSVSQSRACAIRRGDGTLACWSSEEEDDEDGEEGAEPPEPPEGSFAAVSVGDEASCAIRVGGEMACWTLWADDPGSLPFPSDDDTRYRAVDLPCAIDVQGSLHCTASDPEFGPPPPPAGRFIAVSATWESACAIREDGTLACWGRGGMDGDGNDLPMRVPPGQFTAVTVGEMIACATRPDGRAVCWGEHDEGVRAQPSVGLDVPVWAARRDIPVRWGATPAFAAITSYDVEVITGRDPDTAEPTTTMPWLTATATREGTYRGSPGEDVCFRVRARDADQIVSGWTERCTALAHDESVFEPSAGWSTDRSSDYYLGSALTTRERGATLTIDVHAFGVGIVATTCPRCGSIEVFVGNESIGEISLRSPKTRHRQLVFWSDNGEEGFSPEDDPEVSSGDITIKVTSSGRRVTIDGWYEGPPPDAFG